MRVTFHLAESVANPHNIFRRTLRHRVAAIAIIEPYLNRLTARLADGAVLLPESQRDRHRAWLTGLQNADGGFSGREGDSDLYYTGFALRSLAILQGLEPELCTRCAGFLAARLHSPASVIDLFSLLVSRFLVVLGGGPDVFEASGADWPVRVTDLLESFRTPDGGYGRSAESRYGSTYVSFLNLLAMELLERPPLKLEELHEFVVSRQREDGGYVEIAPDRKSVV